MCSDKLLWTRNAIETFLVGSCYYLMVNQCVQNIVSDLFGKIWKTKLRERLKLFLWQVLEGVLLTKSVLCNIVGRGDNLCNICGRGETFVHLFYNCDFVRKLAFASLWWIRFDMVVVTCILCFLC